MSLYAAAPSKNGKEAEPSLEDTQDFVQRRLPEMARVYFAFHDAGGTLQTYSIKTDSVRFDNGGFSAIRHHAILFNPTNGQTSNAVQYTRRLTAKLAELDSQVANWPSAKTQVDNNGTVSWFLVGLQCGKGHPNCVHVEEETKWAQSDPKSTSTDEDRLVIEIWTSDDASRLAKAFSHLISLSGGKATKDPF